MYSEVSKLLNMNGMSVDNSAHVLGTVMSLICFLTPSEPSYNVYYAIVCKKK
jgi:membrane associated rhomboid family serine protease